MPLLLWMSLWMPLLPMQSRDVYGSACAAAGVPVLLLLPAAVPLLEQLRYGI
jgi:hypothetical protein